MATDKTQIINEWHNLLGEMGSEHRVILQNTLLTPSLGFLLEAKIRDCNKRLCHLDTSKDAEEFKTRYRMIGYERDFAESFLSFVKTLIPEQN